MLRATDLAHLLIRQHLQPGDRAVDATLGNGHDAIFLTRLVGTHGRVLAFDPQPAAHEAARREFARQGVDAGPVTFLCCGHEEMSAQVGPGPVAAVMFNLGYLPGGDRHFTTQTATTLTALEAAITLLESGGMLTVIAYPGHPGGAEEGLAVAALLAALPAPWKVFRHECLNARAPAPYLLVALREVEKIR